MHEMILLSGRDLRALLKPAQIIDTLSSTYEALASDRAAQGKSLAFSIAGGSAHIKAGLLPGSGSILAAKVNVNLPENAKLNGLPTIQGAVLVSDTATGKPLALMDSITLTGFRTAGTAMLAARYGARTDSTVATIIGCGAQARYQADGLIACYPIKEIRLYDIDESRSRTFAAELSDSSRDISVTKDVVDAVNGADICILCTTSKHPVLNAEMNLAGCFVAATGADNPQKSEIDPALMQHARVFADDMEQCVAGGDLAHALKAGLVSYENIQADLADVVSGRQVVRTSADQLVIFDSTGSGVQDVAVAYLAYQLARQNGTGTRFDLSG
jgi:ornithine cyclodeaminase/alanine dehydrogenase-like protein (mu-crystallin family)